MEARTTFGRTVIYSSETAITKSNVLTVLNKALSTHNTNKSDIQYLYEYCRGNQPVLYREKVYRTEINNKVVENFSSEIVDFKTGYLFGEPCTYIRSGDKTETSDLIDTLNGYMSAEDKAAKDMEIAKWFSICGTAFRLVLPRVPYIDGESPFEIFTLDPRETFVIYNSGIGNKPLMGVVTITNDTGSVKYIIYTANEYFEIENNEIVSSKPHTLGIMPIFEYPANAFRLGEFERVMSALDAINAIDSNRLDSIEQFVQAFVKFVNCDIDDQSFAKLKEMGAIKVKGEPGLAADVDIVTSELNQEQAQRLVDWLYQSVLVICGMPNRNGGSSTSDTGAAVILRDGWSDAEAMAKLTETVFKKSEKAFLRLALSICKTLSNFDLKISEIDIKFTRRQNDNLLVKTQGLLNMLNAGISPLVAIATCGLFNDPTDVFKQSEENLARWKAQKETAETSGSNQPEPIKSETNDNNGGEV